MKTMKLKVNGSFLELESGSRLEGLIKQLSLETKSGIAVAVNAEVVPRKKWDQQLLQEQDEIVIIEAAQGG